MELKEIIEVLQAAERGESIEFASATGTNWKTVIGDPVWAFNQYKYRIAPKKEMTLVEELRGVMNGSELARRAADRIEFLEYALDIPLRNYILEDLLAEIKRRCQ